jgi:hypothetical protein
MNAKWTMVLALAGMVVVGCGKKSGSDGAASALADVDLAPLPLKIKVPQGGMGAMDMSLGDAKSVTVDIGGSSLGGALNISPEDGDFASVKKQYEGDTVLFPFKSWVKSDATSAVEQFVSDGKTGYIGLSYKTIGGKNYVCKTTGIDGVKDADTATANLKYCDNLVAK